MAILSIQSWVAYGHVGNAAALFPLQLLGFDVWPVNTVNYSNHPAYDSYKGGIYRPEDIAETVAELEKRGHFEECEAVLSGFLGDPGTGPVVLDAVARVKKANPRALYVLDPVMGNAEAGLYVQEGIPAFFREEALPKSDLVVCNIFELGHLAGSDPETAEDAAEDATRLLEDGPAFVCVTGIRKEKEVSNILVTRDQAWQATTGWMTVPAFGSGDLFTALFLADLLRHGEPAGALAQATASVFGILRETWERTGDAMALVAGAHELVEPTKRVIARPLWGD